MKHLQQALTNDMIFEQAPSVFSGSNSGNLSDKYTQVKTIDVVESLRNQGFHPVYASQSNARTPEKRLHTKHVLRFRHEDNINNPENGLFNEMVLVNSHDGLSSYRLMAGLYRIVCGNGLIAGNTFQECRIKHQGDIIGQVIDGTYEIIEESKKLQNRANELSQITLSPEEKNIFAESAHEIIFDGKNSDETGISPQRLLTARRAGDTGKDLFTTFNIVQEHAIRGGLSGYAVAENGRYRNRETGERCRRVSMRPIKSIDRNNHVNQALWSLAEKMADLKGAQ